MRLTHGGPPTAGVASWGSCGLWGTGLASAPTPPLTLHHGLELGDSQMGPSEGAARTVVSWWDQLQLLSHGQGHLPLGPVSQ